MKFKLIVSAGKMMYTVLCYRLIPIPDGRLIRHRGSYKSWSHDVTNVLIPWVNMLKIPQYLMYLFQ